MEVISEKLSIRTSGETNILDITDEVEKTVRKSGLKDGIVTLFVPGSTGALTTIEYEPGLLHDFPAMLERLAPRDADYEHQKRWHDGNGHSHVRASLIGPSLTVPFKERRLTLGTWQQLAFVELDVRSRTRELVVQILGR